MACTECGELVAGAYCRFCESLYFKSDGRRTSQGLRQKKGKWQPKEMRCRKCKNMFMPVTCNMVHCKWCRAEAVRKKGLTEAERWLEKKPRPKQTVTSQQIEYGFFRKQYSPGSQYRTVRG